jgi:nucleoside-specific outer membrane channel protein Tsx
MTLVVFLSFDVKNNFLYLSSFIHRQHAFKARNFYGLSKSVFNSNFIFTFAICYSWTSTVREEEKFSYFGYINWENTTGLKEESICDIFPRISQSVFNTTLFFISSSRNEKKSDENYHHHYHYRIMSFLYGELYSCISPILCFVQ